MAGAKKKIRGRVQARRTPRAALHAKWCANAAGGAVGRVDRTPSWGACGVAQRCAWGATRLGGNPPWQLSARDAALTDGDASGWHGACRRLWCQENIYIRRISARESRKCAPPRHLKVCTLRKNNSSIILFITMVVEHPGYSCALRSCGRKHWL